MTKRLIYVKDDAEYAFKDSQVQEWKLFDVH